MLGPVCSLQRYFRELTLGTTCFFGVLFFCGLTEGPACLFEFVDCIFAR